MTRGIRLLSLMATLLLALFVMGGPVNAQRLPPPERPTGPLRPGAVAILSTADTIAQSGADIAGDWAVIKLEGPDGVQPGQEFTVTAHVTNAIDLYGLQIALNVDLTKFKILSVSPGTLFGTQTTYQVGPTVATDGGSLSYALTLVGQTAIPLDGDGVLATIRLKSLVDSGPVAQVWSGAAAKLGNPEAEPLPWSVSAAPLLIGSIQGQVLSLDQPLVDMTVTLVELSTGYLFNQVVTDEAGIFLLPIPNVDGDFLIRVNELPFLPAAIPLNVTNGVLSAQLLQIDLTYGDWDGDGIITKVDLDRFARLYYGYELYEWEIWIDIARANSSLNRFDLRDLYHVAYNHGLTTPAEASVGWVYGTISNTGGPLKGASIDVSTLAGAYVNTFTTHDDGFYTFKLPAGDYRLTYSFAQHEPLTQTVTVNPLSYRQVFATLPSAPIALANPIQVDLNWNSVGDMDSWLLVPGAVGFVSGQTKTVVSGVGETGQADAHPWAVHAGDVLASRGTETVKIHKLTPGVYEFWSQKVEGDLTAAMNVDVVIAGETHTAQTIRLIDSTGSGYRWRVFKLTVALDGTYVIETINTLHSPTGLSGDGSGQTPPGYKR